MDWKSIGLLQTESLAFMSEKLATNISREIMGISKNLAFDGLNPSPFSKREGYKEFLEMPLIVIG